MVPSCHSRLKLCQWKQHIFSYTAISRYIFETNSSRRVLKDVRETYPMWQGKVYTFTFGMSDQSHPALKNIQSVLIQYKTEINYLQNCSIKTKN